MPIRGKWEGGRGEKALDFFFFFVLLGRKDVTYGVSAGRATSAAHSWKNTVL